MDTSVPANISPGRSFHDLGSCLNLVSSHQRGDVDPRPDSHTCRCGRDLRLFDSKNISSVELELDDWVLICSRCCNYKGQTRRKRMAETEYCRAAIARCPSNKCSVMEGHAWRLEVLHMFSPAHIRIDTITFLDCEKLLRRLPVMRIHGCAENQCTWEIAWEFISFRRYDHQAILSLMAALECLHAIVKDLFSIQHCSIRPGSAFRTSLCP